ncbi:hypothetical protein RF11_07920 [Thelohanellus kitauei]|uniref:Uncharacterized protein n=1 Tax=Thelohanellus kitauei TaxID=669202 RepID=A0A0C2MFT6_THEKT|nr:hypothetical protein RF11_07920 [Thelohanellus kitauei]
MILDLKNTQESNETINAELIISDKRQAFVTITLLRNTIAGRLVDVASDIDSQISKITYITGIAKHVDFIHGVIEDITLTEEFIGLIPIIDTTTADHKQDMSLVTDGARQTISRNIGDLNNVERKAKTTECVVGFLQF